MPAPVPIPDAGTQQLLDQAYSDARTQLKGQVPDSLLHGVPRNPAPDRTSSSTSVSWQNNPDTAPLPTADAPPDGAVPYGADVDSTPPQGAEPVPEQPKMFDGLGKEVGNGLMRGFAGVARTIGLAGGGVLAAVTRGDPEATDAYFKAMDQYINNAYNYWKANPDQSGAGAKIAGNVAGMAAPLLLGPAGGTAMVTGAFANSAMDSVDQDQDTSTAIKIGMLNAAATAAGMKAPGLLRGMGVWKRVLGSAGANIAIDKATEAATKKVLNDADYKEAAKNIDLSDPSSFVESGLMGAIFGALEKGKAKPAAVDVGDVGATSPAADAAPPAGAEAVGAQAAPPAPVADQPSAEPIGDLRAQIADMKDPATARKAVYLSKDNVAELGNDGVADLAKGSKQIRNFDKKGGVLIVPDVATAKDARALRESEPDMQKVLGRLTVAGDGKAPDDTVVVQGQTPDGAVASEGTVRPDEVASKAAEVAAEGKTPVVMTPEKAISRRAEGVVADKGEMPETPPAGAETLGVPIEANKETAPVAIEPTGKTSAEKPAKPAASLLESKVPNEVSAEKPSKDKTSSVRTASEGSTNTSAEKSELAKAMDTLAEQNAKPKGKAFAKPLGARGEDTATAGLVLKAAAKEAKAKGTAGDDAIDRANKAANNAIKLGGKSEEVIKKSQGISHKRIDAINEEMQRATRVLEGRGKPEDEEVLTPRRRQLEAQVEKAKAKKAGNAAAEPAKEAPVAPAKPTEVKAKAPAQEPAQKPAAPKSPEKPEIAVKPYPIKGREDEAIAAFTGINPRTVLNRTPANARPHVMALLQELKQGAESGKGWLGHMFMLDRSRNDEAALNRGQWIQLKGRIERFAKAAPEEVESARHNLETHMNDIEGKRLDDRTQQAVHDYAAFRRRAEILDRMLRGKPEPEPVHDEETVDDRAGQAARDHGADEDEAADDRDISAEVDEADPHYQEKVEDDWFKKARERDDDDIKAISKAARNATVNGVPFFDHLAEAMHSGRFLSAQTLLRQLRAIGQRSGIADRPIVQLVGHLIEHTPDLPVRVMEKVIHPGTGEALNARGVHDSGDKLVQLRNMTPERMIGTLVHELTHAATTYELDRNPTGELALRLTDLLKEARLLHEISGSLNQEPYGLTNPYEFAAEVISNHGFREFLNNLETTRRGLGTDDPLRNLKATGAKSIVQRVMDAISKLLGLKVQRDANGRSLLEEALGVVHGIMEGQSSYRDPSVYRGHEEISQDIKMGGGQIATHDFERQLQFAEDQLSAEPPRLHNEDERFRGVTDAMKPVTRAFSHAFKSGAWQSIRNTVLATMPTDHMFRRYASAFGSKEDPTNPVHRYAEINAQKQTIQNKLLERAQPAAEKWMRLTDAQNRRVGQFMADSTKWGIDPTKTAADHNVTTQRQRNFAARYDHFQDRWNAMSPAEKDVYTSVRDINDYAIREHRKVAVDVALKSFEDELTDGQKRRLHDVRNPKEYDALVGDDKEIDLPGLNDKLKERLHDTAGLAEIEGPYFHLGRDGDLVVQATPEGSREFGTREEAEAFANKVKDLGPSSKATVAERGGKHVVDYRAHYVSMHNSMGEAEADAQRMRDAGFEVQAITHKTLSESGAPLTPALRELVAESERKISSHGKTDESEALTQAMRSAFVHLIAARSAYAGSKLARKGVAGVKPEEMRMAFGRHLQSLSWHTSNLATVFDEAQALGKLREAARKPEVGNADQATMYHRGEFVTELAKRVQQDVQNNSSHSNLNSTIAKVGFLNFLASPAHAAIWLTQNFTTGVPVLGARYGYGKTSRLFMKAMGKPLIAGMREALAGTIRPDKMGDITSSDITRAIVTAVRNHPDFAKWAQGDNSHIQQLLDRGAIGSSYSNELGLVARGEAQWSAKAMEYARLLPHMADAINRVSTALVGLELTKGNVAKTADMIREIHVDYSYGNRPRAFKALPRGMSSIFMMKTYVTNMAHLFYGHAYDLATKQGADRATAIKTAAGMMAGAALFTGITGAIPEPVKWMAYAFNGMFGDDKYFDFDNSIRRWASDAMGKEAGAVASSGLPRLLGMDVSNRMGLSNLFFHEPPDLRTLTKDKAMQFLGSFLGPVPQMVIQQISDAMKHFEAGEIAQGMLSLVPAKALHDAQKAYDLAEEGKKNGAGAVLLKPGDLGTGAIVNQALGFKPGIIADAQSRQGTAFGYKDWATANRSRLVSDYLSKPAAGRKDVMSRITKWNAANPGQRVTVSELIKHERSGLRSGQVARGEQTRDPEVNRLLKY